MNSKKSHCSTFCCNFLTGSHVRILFVTELTHTMCVANSVEKQSRALFEEKKSRKLSQHLQVTSCATDSYQQFPFTF